MNEFVPRKGTILKGNESFSNHQFSRDTIDGSEIRRTSLYGSPVVYLFIYKGFKNILGSFHAVFLPSTVG